MSDLVTELSLWALKAPGECSGDRSVTGTPVARRALGPSCVHSWCFMVLFFSGGQAGGLVSAGPQVARGRGVAWDMAVVAGGCPPGFSARRLWVRLSWRSLHG